MKHINDGINYCIAFWGSAVWFLPLEQLTKDLSAGIGMIYIALKIYHEFVKPKRKKK